VLRGFGEAGKIALRVRNVARGKGEVRTKLAGKGKGRTHRHQRPTGAAVSESARRAGKTLGRLSGRTFGGLSVRKPVLTKGGRKQSPEKCEGWESGDVVRGDRKTLKRKREQSPKAARNGEKERIIIEEGR